MNTCVDTSMHTSMNNIEQRSNQNVDRATPDASSLVDINVPSMNASMHTSRNSTQEGSSQNLTHPHTNLDIVSQAASSVNNSASSMNASMNTSKSNNIQRQGSSPKVEQSNNTYNSTLDVYRPNTDMNTSVNTSMHIGKGTIQQQGSGSQDTNLNITAMPGAMFASDSSMSGVFLRGLPFESTAGSSA